MHQATGREKQIIDERKKKIDGFRNEGLNPYPNRFSLLEEKRSSSDIKEEFASLKNESYSNSKCVVAGRIMTKRSFGKLSFMTLQDVKGTIQVMFKKGETPDGVLSLFKKVDAGDIVGSKGLVTKTKTGEVSIRADELHLLTKSVLPLPDKHKGLKNEDERLRKRYLDVITNADVKDIFVKKQRFWSTMRSFLIDHGFLEVETPVLENSAGGAAATPFKTHHNALDIDVYLRISMGELWQKKLLVAGYEKTFEIGRQFRNEGMDAEHLQDYTQMEFYWGYACFKDGMRLVEELYKELAKAVLDTTSFKANGHTVDLAKKWQTYDFESLIEKETKINIYKATKGDIMKALSKLKIECDETVDKWRLIDLLWKYCRKKISGPGFLVGQPVELTPLAKRSQEDPRKVEQFQVILAGSEVGNGYSELNDPADQDERFKEQRSLQEEGDSEAMDHDAGFVEALRYGMPPACGFGVSERLFSFMLGRPLRECVAFPLMRPEESAADAVGKARETKVAVALINKGCNLEKWQELNAIAHLSASFAARIGKGLFLQDHVVTRDGKRIPLNIQHAIMIKEAGSNADLLEVGKSASSEGLEVVEFTREMIETTNDQKVIEETAKKNRSEVELLGVLVFGKKSLVEKVTKAYKLVE